MDESGARVLRGRQNVEQVLKKGPVEGYVLQMDVATKETALVPQEMSYKARGQEAAPVPQASLEAMQASLPLEVRRTARERMRALTGRLVADGLAMKRATGKVVFPKSVEDEIRLLGAAEGDPRLLERIEAGSVKAIERYAGFLMDKAARNQRKGDVKKTALDWHGHYNT